MIDYKDRQERDSGFLENLLNEPMSMKCWSKSYWRVNALSHKVNMDACHYNTVSYSTILQKRNNV